MLRCNTCTQLKPDEAFAIRFKTTGERVSMCRVCKTAYNKVWYQRHKGRQKLAVKRNNARYAARARAYITAAKDHPCADCGGSFPPICMDFDHVSGEKVANLAAMVSNSVPLERLAAEIEKCELVCSNCHRLRTRERWQYSHRREATDEVAPEPPDDIDELVLTLWDEVA